jgi:hypothetical protein
MKARTAIQITLRPDEDRLARKMAAAAKLPVSTFLRSVVLRYMAAQQQLATTNGGVK